MSLSAAMYGQEQQPENTDKVIVFEYDDAGNRTVRKVKDSQTAASADAGKAQAPAENRQVIPYNED